MSGAARVDLRLAETVAELRACHPVMAQLRPELDEDAFIDRVRRQRLLGYRLLTARAPRGPVVGVAGFVLGETLAAGRHLRIDDLVTDERVRSRGVGRALLDWLRAYAVEADCEYVVLDLAPTSEEARRFPLREGFSHRGERFRLALAGGDGPQIGEADGRVQLRGGAGPLGENTLYPDVDANADGAAEDATDIIGAEDDEDFDPSHEGGLDPDFR